MIEEQAIAIAIDAKNPCTHGRSQRVSEFLLTLVKEMQPSPESSHQIRAGGLLHDVEKIGISDQPSPSSGV